MRIGRAIVTGAAAISAVPFARIAHACAMCGLSPGDVSGHAYNASVLFMLAGPYFTVLAIGGIAFAVWKRAQRRDNAGAPSPRRQSQA